MLKHGYIVETGVGGWNLFKVCFTGKRLTGKYGFTISFFKLSLSMQWQNLPTKTSSCYFESLKEKERNV